MLKNKNIQKILIFVLLLIVVLIFLHYSHMHEYLSVAGFNHYQDVLTMYAHKNIILFVCGYILLYIASIAACLPGTIIFDIVAGFIFGIFGGTILVLFSYLSGATINFLIIRFFFQDMCTTKFKKWRQLIHGSGKYGLFLNLTSLRLIGIIPFWALNILAALLNIRLSIFILSTLIGITPTSIIYVVLGNGLHESVIQHNLKLSLFLNPQIWIPLVLTALLLIAPNIISGIKNHVMRKPK